MNYINICIISADSQPQHLGGIKRVTSILGEQWIKHGHNCCYLTLCSSMLRKQKIKNIPQYFLPNPKDITSLENESFFIRFIQDNHIDIIINPHVEEKGLTNLVINVHHITNTKLISALHFSPTHTYKTTKASYFVSYSLEKNIQKWFINFLLWCRFHLYKGKKILKSERQWTEKVLQESDHFVVLSERFLHYFDQNQNKISAINNPTDPEISNKIISKKQKTILWCGRLDLAGTKRVDRILRIWKKIYGRHNDWNLYILGSGDSEKVKRIIYQHGIKNVYVEGFCNPYDYYKQAAIVTMTSTTEGWGMVLVEGQSFGCVPIAFDSYESIHDIIQHEKTGILVKPFDLTEYARQLEKLMDDEKYRNRIMEESLLSVKRFHPDVIALQWENLFFE